MRKIAAIGDIHGNLKALKALYQKLMDAGVTEVYHLGDLVDRGEDPGGVLAFCIEKSIKGVIGNHDEALMRKHVAHEKPPRNPDKLKSYRAILNTPGAEYYLAALPKILVIEEFKTILVHAGVDPLKTLEEQNSVCCYVSMVNPAEPGMSRWWNTDRKGRSEVMNRLEGWERWYRLYNFPYHVVHGHNVHRNAHVSAFPKQPQFFRVAVDTGAWYTGKLTAAIITNDQGPSDFISTPIEREGTFHENPE